MEPNAELPLPPFAIRRIGKSLQEGAEVGFQLCPVIGLGAIVLDSIPDRVRPSLSGTVIRVGKVERLDGLLGFRWSQILFHRIKASISGRVQDPGDPFGEAEGLLQ